MFHLPFRPRLSNAQRKTWQDHGYLHLKGAVSRVELNRVKRSVEQNWANPQDNPHNVDVLTGEYAGKCFQMKDTPPLVKAEAYKLNNLFLYDNSIRSVALSNRLKPIMEELLGCEPLICNSLNFERGSQQDAHIDSWYMPPPDDKSMVAASISLDAVDDNNGPIFFYPGSHKIPPYRFSDGRLNVIDSEFSACLAYIRTEIEQRSLPLIRYRGDPGDVFIWHGQLIHGGSPITDFARTRNSLVVHYWRAQDVAKQSVARDEGGRAYLAHTLRGELEPLRMS